MILTEHLDGWGSPGDHSSFCDGKAHRKKKMFNSRCCGPDLSSILPFWNAFLHYTTSAYLPGPQITLLKAQIKFISAVQRRKIKEWRGSCTDLSQKVRETYPHDLLLFQFSAPLPRFPSFSLLTFTWIKHKLSLLFTRSHTLPKWQVSPSHCTAFLLSTSD